MSSYRKSVKSLGNARNLQRVPCEPHCFLKDRPRTSSSFLCICPAQRNHDRRRKKCCHICLSHKILHLHISLLEITIHNPKLGYTSIPGYPFTRTLQHFPAFSKLSSSFTADCADLALSSISFRAAWVMEQ